MAELGRGVKAGVVSGAIYGPVNWLIINLVIQLSYGNLERYIAVLMTEGEWFLGCFIENLISGLIFGLILGLIFAAVYDRLPGKTPTIKGIVISLIYWVIIPLGLPVLYFLYQWGFEDFYWFWLVPGMWKATVIGLGPSVIWGWLLGYFWESDWFGRLIDKLVVRSRKDEES